MHTSNQILSEMVSPSLFLAPPLHMNKTVFQRRSGRKDVMSAEKYLGNKHYLFSSWTPSWPLQSHSCADSTAHVTFYQRVNWQGASVGWRTGLALSDRKKREKTSKPSMEITLKIITHPSLNDKLSESFATFWMRTICVTRFSSLQVRIQMRYFQTEKLFKIIKMAYLLEICILPN